jgi:hypothetical protein
MLLIISGRPPSSVRYTCRRPTICGKWTVVSAVHTQRRPRYPCCQSSREGHRNVVSARHSRKAFLPIYCCCSYHSVVQRRFLLSQMFKRCNQFFPLARREYIIDLIDSDWYMFRTSQRRSCVGPSNIIKVIITVERVGSSSIDAIFAII